MRLTHAYRLVCFGALLTVSVSCMVACSDGEEPNGTANQQPRLATDQDAATSSADSSARVPDAGVVAAAEQGGTGATAMMRSPGDPVVLASKVDATAIACDGQFVYWADFKASALMRVAVSGGSPQMIAPVDDVEAMALDDTSLYWTSWPPGSTVGSVSKVALGGNSPTVLASNQNNPRGIAVDANYVYWTVGDINGGAIMRLPLDGGTPAPLATGQIDPEAIAVGPTHVVWTNKFDSKVMGLARAGGAPVTLASAQEGLSGLAVDAKYVYWTSLDGVVKAPLAGGGASILSNVPMTRAWMVVDGSNLYWTARDGVFRVNLDTGLVRSLVTDQRDASGLAVDSTSIYWTVTDHDDALMKASKSGAGSRAGDAGVSDAGPSFECSPGAQSMPGSPGDPCKQQGTACSAMHGVGEAVCEEGGIWGQCVCRLP